MIPAPFLSDPLLVRPEWTDYNGHLNMAYYHVLFDTAIDHVLETLGLGPAVAQTTGQSAFTAQAHVHYLRELATGMEVVVETRLIAHDDKRLHYVQTMRHSAEEWTAAVTENLLLHIDLTSRRVSPWSDEVVARLADAVQAHADLPVPEQVGRRVGLRRR